VYLVVFTIRSQGTFQSTSLTTILSSTSFPFVSRLILHHIRDLSDDLNRDLVVWALLLQLGKVFVLFKHTLCQRFGFRRDWFECLKVLNETKKM